MPSDRASGERCPGCGSDKRNKRLNVADPEKHSDGIVWCRHPWHIDPVPSCTLVNPKCSERGPHKLDTIYCTLPEDEAERKGEMDDPREREVMEANQKWMLNKLADDEPSARPAEQGTTQNEAMEVIDRQDGAAYNRGWKAAMNRAAEIVEDHFYKRDFNFREIAEMIRRESGDELRDSRAAVSAPPNNGTFCEHGIKCALCAESAPAAAPQERERVKNPTKTVLDVARAYCFAYMPMLYLNMPEFMEAAAKIAASFAVSGDFRQASREGK